MRELLILEWCANLTSALMLMAASAGKHDHSVSLADAGIDASVTRSGSMPSLVRQTLDRAALSTPRGFKALPLHRVAFVLVNGGVAFDAESPRAWDRFARARPRHCHVTATSLPRHCHASTTPRSPPRSSSQPALLAARLSAAASASVSAWRPSTSHTGAPRSLGHRDTTPLTQRRSSRWP